MPQSSVVNRDPNKHLVTTPRAITTRSVPQLTFDMKGNSITLQKDGSNLFSVTRMVLKHTFYSESA